MRYLFACSAVSESIYLIDFIGEPSRNRTWNLLIKSPAQDQTENNQEDLSACKTEDSD